MLNEKFLINKIEWLAMVYAHWQHLFLYEHIASDKKKSQYEVSHFSFSFFLLKFKVLNKRI